MLIAPLALRSAYCRYSPSKTIADVPGGTARVVEPGVISVRARQAIVSVRRASIALLGTPASRAIRAASRSAVRLSSLALPGDPGKRDQGILANRTPSRKNLDPSCLEIGPGRNQELDACGLRPRRHSSRQEILVRRASSPIPEDRPLSFVTAPRRDEWKEVGT